MYSRMKGQLGTQSADKSVVVAPLMVDYEVHARSGSVQREN